MITQENERTMTCERKKSRIIIGFESMALTIINLENKKYIGGCNKYTAYEIEAKGKNTNLSKTLRVRL